METISNVATAAAHVVTGNGESKQEPVSGQMGDVSKGEPFDAGNMGDDAQPGQETDGKEQGNRDTTTMGTESTRERTEADGDDNDDAGATLGNPDEEEADGVKIEGPGPKPIEAVALERGGDAGHVDVPGRTNGSSSRAARDPAPASSVQEGDGDDPDAQDSGGGAAVGRGGDKYVRSSGFRADGGDFDAANPGAGREADRLLEEKGIHRDDKGRGDSGSSAGEQGEAKEGKKPTVRDRIKAKLHHKNDASGQ